MNRDAQDSVIDLDSDNLATHVFGRFVVVIAEVRNRLGVVPETLHTVQIVPVAVYDFMQRSAKTTA